MSDTISVSESMTALELQTALAHLAKTVSKNCHVHAGIAAGQYGGESVYLSVEPDGIASKSKGFSGSFKTYPEAFSAAHDWIAQREPVQRNALIRKMALAIIELTDEHGRCTQAMLRGRDFTADEIAEFRDSACVRAGKMAGNAPFEVVS